MGWGYKDDISNHFIHHFIHLLSRSKEFYNSGFLKIVFPETKQCSNQSALGLPQLCLLADACNVFMRKRYKYTFLVNSRVESPEMQCCKN